MVLIKNLAKNFTHTHQARQGRCTIRRVNFLLNALWKKFFHTRQTVHDSFSVFRGEAPDSRFATYAFIVSLFTAMAAYDEMVAKDLELLYSIQDYCQKRPWIDNRISRIVSKYPWQDIVVVLWILFIVGVIEIGNSHFWIVCLNLGAAFGM